MTTYCLVDAVRAWGLRRCWCGRRSRDVWEFRAAGCYGTKPRVGIRDFPGVPMTPRYEGPLTKDLAEADSYQLAKVYQWFSDARVASGLPGTVAVNLAAESMWVLEALIRARIAEECR